MNASSATPYVLRAKAQDAPRTVRLTVPYSPAVPGDLLYNFVQQAGEFETPQEWIFWSGISMIAAAVGDRVYFDHLRSTPLYPNMFVFLMGMSGAGKGLAIKQATKFLKHLPRVRLKEAKVTSKRLIDWMAEEWVETDPGRIEMDNARIYLVTPELSFSLDSGELAEDFLKFATGIYEGNMNMEEGTRMWGDRVVPNPMINWLGGSDVRWLKDCISLPALLSGFGARTCFIDPTVFPPRRYKPKYRPDQERLEAYVGERVRQLSQLQGRFVISPEANELAENWYMGRVDPEDPQLAPFFNRERAHVQKLSMIMSLSESNDLSIKRRHVASAIRLIASLRPALLRLVRVIAVSNETRGIDELRDYIKSGTHVDEKGQVVGVRYNLIARKMSLLGIGRHRLSELLVLLRQSNEIDKVDTPNKASIYSWKQSYRVIDDPADAEEPAVTDAERLPA